MVSVVRVEAEVDRTGVESVEDDEKGMATIVFAG